jgi:hypothetical protein
MSGVASWAVFLDDTAMLQTVASYFKSGEGNGKLTNYIIDAEGECQESGRDQGGLHWHAFFTSHFLQYSFTSLREQRQARGVPWWEVLM